MQRLPPQADSERDSVAEPTERSMDRAWRDAHPDRAKDGRNQNGAAGG